MLPARRGFLQVSGSTHPAPPVAHSAPFPFSGVIAALVGALLVERLVRWLAVLLHLQQQLQQHSHDNSYNNTYNNLNQLIILQ
ncbi:MAG: hypothetical protein HZT40_18245 [Candidatus Thiothrix singaporensis]|uniref:Uncharacterized protein n=1 Tax=Candidatus Thiothrix singaporensis TaxID=2799669 RepID=A0A7L6AW71_9GAMM|nr:MAG: hypothetical protein HZT40_18245 [Candidatus Thiothrix singaporensis]